VHALDKRDHPLEPNEGAVELQLISPDRDLRIGGGQGLKAAAEQGCLVFCAEGGRAFKENECKWPMWRACKMAGLRRISWHVLRHTFEGGRQSRPSLLFQTPASVRGSRSKIAALARSARCLREPLCSAPGRRRAVASGSHLETA